MKRKKKIKLSPREKEEQWFEIFEKLGLEYLLELVTKYGDKFELNRIIKKKLKKYNAFVNWRRSGRWNVAAKASNTKRTTIYKWISDFKNYKNLISFFCPIFYGFLEHFVSDTSFHI